MHPSESFNKQLRSQVGITHEELLMSDDVISAFAARHVHTRQSIIGERPSGLNGTGCLYICMDDDTWSRYLNVST